jgi:fibronectin-binding autotransporter adhesin
MLLMSWLNALKSGLIRGHWNSRRRMTGSHLRRGDHAPVAVRAETLEDRALLANTFTVDDSGSANFLTISAAVAAAADGDTIQVAAGNYAEQVTVNKSLTILGAQAGQDARVRSVPLSAESVTTGVAGSTVFVISASGVTIDGFVVQGHANANPIGASIYMQPGFSGTQLKNNIVQDNLVGVFAANNNAASPAVIQQNLFRNNTRPGASSGHSIYADNFTAGGALVGLQVDNNSFTNSSVVVDSWAMGLSNAGVSPFSDITFSNNSVTNHGRGAYFFNTKDSVVSGNTISGTTNYAVGILEISTAVSGNSNIAVTNNTLSDNAVGVRVQNSLNAPVDFSAYTGSLNLSGNTITGGGTGLSLVEPNINSVNLAGVTISGTSTASTIQIGGSISYTGGSGNESIVSSASSIAVSGGSTIQAISLSGVTQQVLSGSGGDDTFDVTPSAGVIFDIDGGAPTTAPGDLLIYRGTGLSGVVDNGLSVSATGVGAVNYLAVERITLDGVTTPSVTPGGGNDAIRLFVEGGVTYYQVGTNQPIAIPNATNITIEGGNGNDTFTIDYTGGDPIPAAGITFNGGDPTMGTGDTLVIKGTGAQNPIYTPNNTSFGSGSISIGGKTITFTGLEPVDFDAVGDFTLNLPNSNDVVTLEDGFLLDGTTPAVRIFGTSNGVAFESARVSAVSITIDTVAGGVDGNDTITVSSVQAAAGITDLTINTGAGTDSVVITGATSITGNLLITSAGALTGAGNLSAGGTATLTTAGVNLTGVVTVTGTTSITAGTSVVSLGNTANNFGGAVTVVSGGDTTLVDVNNLAVAGATLTGQFVSLSDQIAITGTISTGGNNILLQQSNTTAGGTIGLGDAATGNFNLDASEITFLSSSGTVTIGQLGGLGAVDVNDLALAGETFNLLINGGAIGLASVTLATDKTLTLRSNGPSGAVTDDNGAAANVTISGAGALVISAAAGVGSLADPIETAVANWEVAGGTGGVFLSDADGVTVTGAGVSGSSILLTADGLLTASSAVSAVSGTVTLVADDLALAAAVTGGTGVTLRPLDAGTAITLGTAGAGLVLSDTELDFVSTSGTLVVGDAAINGTATVNAAIDTSGTSRLTVVAGGTLTFSGTGSIVENTLLSLTAGSIVVGTNVGVIEASAATVSVTTTTGAIATAADPLTVNAATGLSLATSGNQNAFVDTTTGATLTSANAGSGTVTLRGGTFTAGASDVVDNATSLSLDGVAVTYALGATSDTVGGLRVNSASPSGITGSGTITSLSAFDLQAGTIGANLAGSVAVNKTGAGVVRLAGTNSFTGALTISEGEVRLQSAGAIPTGTFVDLTDGTAPVSRLTLEVAANIGGLQGVANSVVDLNGFQLSTNVAGTDRTFAGNLVGGAGSNLVKTGGARLTLTGANTYAGTTAVNGGTLRIGDGTASGALGNLGVTLANGTTLEFSPSAAGYNVGNGITGTGTTTIRQLTGRTTLHNTNSVTNTIVDGGRLEVGGGTPGSLTSSVTVNALGTLGGTGSITGNVSGTGTVSPGTSPGILTINGNFSNSGTLAFEVNATGATAGTDYDRLVVNGTVDISGATLSFSGTAAGVATNALLTLIANDGVDDVTAAGTLPTNGTLVNINGVNFRVYYNGGDGNDVVLVQAGLAPIVYVEDTLFAGYNLGEVIPDADFGTTGNQPAIFGVEAFSALVDAIAGATASGTIVVNSGTYTTGTLSGTQTLRVTGVDVAGAVTINSLTTVAGQVVQIDGTSVLTLESGSVGGVVQGSGSLTKTTAATLTLGGNNTYTGLTTVSGGTLAVTANNALGTTAAGTTVASGATLDFSGVTYATTEGLTVNGGALANNSTTTDSSFAGAILLGADSTATVGTAARSLTLSGNITDGAGVFSLTKTGAGTLGLSGTNTFENRLRISAGNVTVSGGQAIADNARVDLNASGASLTLAASETINQLQGVAGTTINLNANTLTSNTGVTTTYAGSINGSGGLTKDGAGTLTLSGTNTFTGATSILGGGLDLAGGSALADTTAVTLANTAGVFVSLQANERIGSLAGGGTTGGSIFLNSNTLTTGDATSTMFNGIIGGSGGVTKVGAGTFTLTGVSVYTGATTISDGSLVLNNAGGNALSDSTAVNLDTSGANLTLSTNETVGSLAGVAGSGVTLNGTLTAGGTNATTVFVGSANGAGGLTKVGTGTLTLSGANGFSGPVTINAGGVTVSGGSAIANGTAVVLANVSGAVLTLSTSEQIGSLAGGGTTGGNVVLGSNLLTVGDGTSTVYGGVIGGSGGQLTKVGAGELQLTGANTFTGATTISAGSLTLNNVGGAALSDSTAVNLDTAGATLVLTTGETIGSLAGVASSVVTLNANTLTTGGNNGTTAFGGAIGGTGGLTKSGVGTMSLTGVNTYGGTTTISAGSLVLNNASGTAINDVSNVDLNVSGANLTLSSTTETIGSLTGTLGTTVSLGANTLTTTTAANSTMQGVISGTGGSLVKNGTGELTLSAANTYTGTTTVGVGGSIRLFGTDGTLGGGNVSNSGTVRFERGSPYLVANNITGTGAIVQNGSGLVTLSGTNTAGAGTTVSFGRLDVNGTLTSNVTVGAAGALGGTGTVTGNVTGAGVVAPGTSPGILNVVGTFGPVGSLDVEINGIVPGTQHDQVNVTGGVNLGGTTVLVIGTSTIASVPGQQLVLINNDGTDAIAGTFSGRAEGSTVTVNGQSFVISYIGGLDGNDVTLTQAGAITITGTAAGDELLLQEETISGLDYISYYLGGVLQTRWLSSAVTTVTVNAGDGDDRLTVNYGATGGFFAKNITFNGGNQATALGDRLVLDDSPTPPALFGTITHSFTNNNDGSVTVDGTTITYTGLEPIVDNLDAANRVFTFTGANETISLTASGAQSQLDSTLGESVVFSHPTTSLTINSTNGTDTINLTSIGSAFSANVTVNSNSTSTVNFDSTVLNVGAGNFAVDAAGTVNFSAGGLTTTGNATLSNVGTGGVTTNAAGVDIAANGLTISSAGAVGTVANPLRTSVTTVTSASTTGAGSAIFLTETDGVTLTSVTTTDGAVTIAAGGTVTATSVTAGGTARDVRITTTGGTSDIALGLVTAAGDLVSLNAGGAITDNNGASNNIASATLALQATTGIGSTDAIETALTGSAQFAFVNTTSGDVQVTNTGALNVFNVDGIGGTGVNASRNLGGAVVLTANAGDLTFIQDATAQTNFTIRTPENGAGSSGQNDVVFDTALVTATTGNIVIESGDDINGGNLGVLRTLHAPAGHIRLRSSFNDADADGRQSWGTAHIEAGTYIALEVGAAAEDVAQTADSRFIAPSLELRGLGTGANTFTLDGTNNDVDTLAGSTRGVIRYVDADGLTIGTVTGIGTTVGLSNALGTAAITLTTGGALVIDDDVSANSGSASGAIRLNVTGTITQNAGDDITGFGLALSGTGTTTLTNTGNNVVEFASNRDGELAYTDASALKLDSVAGLNGVTMGTNTVTFTTTGTLDHEGATGNLVAGNVRILGSGDVSLPTAARNAVGTLAISRTSGIVDFTDSDALTIGTVTGTLGASAGTTNGVLTTGNITVATNTLALTLDQNVTTNTTGTVVRLQGATDIVQNTTSVVTGATLGARAETGSIDLDSINQVGIFASASGTTTVFRNGQALTVDQVSAFSGFTPTATGMTGTDLEVVTTAGRIQFARASTASGTFRVQADGGEVTQTGGSVLSAANLGVRATGNVDLGNATNTVSGNFAAVSTGTGFIAFLDAGGFTVGTVAAGQFFTAVTGVTTNDGLINLNTSGDLTVTDVVTAVGTGRNVTLTTTAGGNVALNGIVTADGDVVNITSAGNITDSPANTVNNITAATINLNAVTGIGATGLNGAVETTAATVNATNTTSGGIFLNSLSVVNFNNIQAQTAGDIELTSSLAATLTTVNAASGNVTGVVTSGNLTVATSVTAGGTGDISLTTVAGNIVLTGTTTALADDVTLTASGSITGTGLVSGNTLTGLAGTGIGVGTGNRVQTAVSLIRLNAAGGDVYLNNVSAALTTYSLVSPAGVGINASGLVDLITSNDLTIANGARVTAGGSITLQGGAANSGATITLDDTLDGGGTELVLGGTGADAIIVNDMSATNPVNLNGQAGSDSYTVNYFSAFMPGATANINVVDSSSSLGDNDTLNIYGTNVVDDLNVKEDTWLGGSFRTTITGGHTGRVNYIAPTPSNARLTTLNVYGLDGQDNFFVSPSRYFTINIFGGTPSFGPGAGDVPQVGLGDTLDYDPNGQNFTIEGRSILTSSFGIAAPSLQPVRFSNIENLPLREIGSGTRYFDFDGTYPTTPRTYSPTQPGYTQVLASDLYVAGNTAYTFIPGGTTYAGRLFGWEALRDNSNVLLTDANGFYVSPVETFDLASVGALATPYASLLRDGHGSGSSNIRKSIFRFEVPNPGANAGKWYVVSVKVGKPDGNVDQMRIKNADDPDPVFFQANNITVANQQYGEFKFPVRANSNGEIRLEFSDNGGVEPHWYVNSLELRPGQLLSFGSPPTTLDADGQTIDTHTIYGAIPGSVVTISSSLGTIQMGGAFPDIDPAMQGLQRPVDGSGQAQFRLQRASGPGLAFLQYDAISAIEGTFENTGFGEIDFVAPPTRRFDFGVYDSPVQTPAWAPTQPDGYVPVTTSSAYTATSGFGWVGAPALNINYNVSLASPYASLLRDANWDTAPRQFAIDLPAGTYQFSATVGSISVAGQNFSVVSGGTAIDLSQVTNFSTTAGQYKTLNFTVTKTGTAPLVLDFRNLNSGFQWSINGLQARTVGAVTAVSVTPPVGTAQADGTTVDTFTVSGAGISTGTRLFTIATTLGTLFQINGAAIVDADPNFAGIQFDPTSDTFTVQVTRPGSAGVATVSVDEVTGAARGSGSRTYTAFSGPRQYDFGTLTSPIQTGYTGVFPTTIYSAGTGFGWLAANTSAVDRGVPPLAATRPDLTRDSANALSAGTFRTDLVPSTTYEVTATLGDTDPRDGVNVRYSVDGGATFLSGLVGVNTAAGVRVHRTFTVTTGALGSLIIEISDGGGTAPSWSLAGLEIRTPVTPFSITGTATEAANGTSIDSYSVTGATTGAVYTISSAIGTVVTADADAYYAGVQIVAPSPNFSVQIQRPNTAGVNSISVSEVTGASRSAVASTNFTASASRWYDFNAVGSPTQAGFVGVSPTAAYNVGTGFGWVSTSGIEGKNFPGSGDLLSDHQWHRTGAQFRLDVAAAPIGQTIVLQFRDPFARQFSLQVLNTSGTPIPFSAGGPTVTTLAYTVLQNVSQTLTLTLQAAVPAGNIRVNFIGRFSVAAMQFSTPQLAAVEYVGDNAGEISASQLAATVEVAKARWLALGLTAAQKTVLAEADIQLADFGADRHLGVAYDGRTARIDDDAAGYGWFVDGSALDDSEFVPQTGTVLQAATGAAAGQFDLLTVVMHELGNLLRLSGAGLPESAADLMLPTLGLGTRRLPSAVQGVVPSETGTSTTPGANASGSLVGVVLDDRTPFGQTVKSNVVVAGNVEAPELPVALPRKSVENETTDYDAYFTLVGKKDDLLPF